MWRAGRNEEHSINLAYLPGASLEFQVFSGGKKGSPLIYKQLKTLFMKSNVAVSWNRMQQMWLFKVKLKMSKEFEFHRGVWLKSTSPFTCFRSQNLVSMLLGAGRGTLVKRWEKCWLGNEAVMVELLVCLCGKLEGRACVCTGHRAQEVNELVWTTSSI